MTVSADFEREGYALFRKAIDVAEVARLEQEIVQSYWGPLYRHDLRMMRHSDLDPDDDVERSGLMDSHLWELPELGSFSRALRSLLFSDAIYEALHAIDGEARYTLHQSIFFFRSPRLGPHLDRSTLDTAPAARSFTVWIAVDPVSPLNGPTYVVPTPRGQYWIDPGTAPAGQNKLVHDWVSDTMPGMLLLAMNAGDVAVWAPTTPHGSMVAWPEMKTRRSIQAIYRPTSILHWGNRPERLGDFHNVKFEEKEINGRFNCLISKQAETNEHFERAARTRSPQ